MQLATNTQLVSIIHMLMPLRMSASQALKQLSDEIDPETDSGAVLSNAWACKLLSDGPKQQRRAGCLYGCLRLLGRWSAGSEQSSHSQVRSTMQRAHDANLVLR